MSNFLQKGFPTDRWALTDPSSLIANCIASIDASIRTVFQITGSDGTTPKTTDFTTGTYPVNMQENLFRVLHDFQIGSGEVVSDIVDSIPVAPGGNENEELATVEAIRDFVAAYALSWGEDLYIPIITTPTAGNFPLMTAEGELETSSWNQDTWITRIVGPIAGNFPMMQANGLLSATVYGPTDFVAAGNAMEPVAGAVAQNIPIFVDSNTLEDSGVAIADLASASAFGAVQVRDAIPGTSTSTLTAQSMDSILWYQGKGNSIFSLSSGKVKVAYSGLYCVHLQAIVVGSVQVITNSYCDGGGSSWASAEPVSGDSYTYCDLLGWHALDANDELEFKIRTPAGNASIQAFVATVVKVGPDGATFTP